MSCTDSFGIDATIIANEFIEKYMPEANGDYVKVYLYLLKNRHQGVDVSVIAEALYLTEGDVRRAIKYWEDKGIVSVGRKEKACKKSGEDACIEGEASMSDASSKSIDEVSGADGKACFKEFEDTSAYSLDYCDIEKSVVETASDASPDGTADASTDASVPAASETEKLKECYKNADGKAAINRLKGDDEFEQLLFIVQKYLARLLKERDLEILAFLYDGLKLPCDVIDYLVEYCVEHKHTSMRYIEKTGIDWAEIGIRDVAAAKRRTAEFDKVINEAKASTEKKKKKTSDRQGMMRDFDFDELIRNRVLERI